MSGEALRSRAEKQRRFSFIFPRIDSEFEKKKEWEKRAKKVAGKEMRTKTIRKRSSNLEG